MLFLKKDKEGRNEHCGQNPVIFVSFKGVECDTWNNLISSFRSVLNKVFVHHMYMRASKNLEEDEIENFCNYVHESKVRTSD
jgi:hypothetical protein